MKKIALWIATFSPPSVSLPQHQDGGCLGPQSSQPHLDDAAAAAAQGLQALLPGGYTWSLPSCVPPVKKHARIMKMIIEM